MEKKVIVIGDSEIIISDTEEEEIEEWEGEDIEFIGESVPAKPRLRPPDEIDLEYEFSYLNERISMKEVLKRVLPPSVYASHIKRMTPNKKNKIGYNPAKKWYDMWFYMLDPNSTFQDQYDAIIEGLTEWNEPKGWRIHPKLIEEEQQAAEMEKRKKLFAAKIESQKYGVPMEYFVNKFHSDGKDRSNPEGDKERFYYSYLITSIESMDVDTSTKVGKSRRPICKVLYHQMQFLNSESSRSTHPKKYRLELFIGPFVSEDAAMEFNQHWKSHRGAQPRRSHAIEFAQDRGMICVDVRSIQPSTYIDDLRKTKKARKNVRL